ncbi:potassium channel subfamily K member 15-like [Panulirus ornatus]|uniref:potassium channel subfamily K member 15-like n=1 Tax=Panulirus ornatus TaxID=150431 RepID=UPI003A8463A3
MCRSSQAELGGGGAGVGGGKAGGVRLRFLAWVSSLKSSAPQVRPLRFLCRLHRSRSQVYSHVPQYTPTYILSLGAPQARLSKALQVYEGAVEDAVGAGVSPLDPDLPNYHWSYIKSVFFASTVITTIGYGNTAPVTTWGRFFCILFGFVGIPVTITVIADLGTMFANMVSALARYLASFTKTCRPFKKLRAPVLQKGSRWLMVLGSIGALLVYIAIGGVLFIQWENWTFFEAFYFCFITMTTIGLGDFVPVRTEFMLVCTLYILVGLALTSTIIELVRRQYAESWQQFKELSGRLGELSGPLADQLKRLGEQAGDISIDVHLMKDLKELRNALQLSTRLEAISRMDPKLRSDAKLVELLKAHLNGQENSEDALSEKEPLQPEANKKKVIQVVIYESSV